ncbi:NAD(P)/FAD-dependent oxidoreductase [Pseudidiomarina sp.]|uniref:NAD(P)/FAD-dependent oxidoreductase n=1 Tax=Pseudidiomarina sp. TaxID=2081707 RepID=UPI00299EAD5D|nr:FAD-dependent oxidoreductase [Pseudidiomarina sp.]MDX1705543.1 FAD-dependent oxidoreductase [Pseudidiomarina sp.]
MKIAIIGSGISGLTSAWLLNPEHEISVFEKNDYIGGHTRTVKVRQDGHDYHVDTGFIVFNDKTYPNFRALLRKLDVKWRDTEMSFSVRDPKSGLEYNGHNLNTLFAQRRNLFSPDFYRLITGILKFNKAAKAAYDKGDALNEMTLGDFLRQQDLPQSVSDLYLLPMVAAIWSASLAEAEAYPLGFFLRFFNNHGLLNIADRPQWHTVIGGSSAYIEPMIAGFRDHIQLNTELRSVHRNHPDRKLPVTLEFADGRLEDFDEVVFACHSDEALALLADPTDAEREILSAMPYQMNDVVLHTDLRLLPRNRRAWASWNYLLHSDSEARTRPSSVTYNMNILQGIKAPVTFCVTLNNTNAIHTKKIIGKYQYAHPVYSVESLAATRRRGEICGQQHTHFTGAYWYNGFHEDGVCSAIDVAQRLGVKWRVE